MTTQEVMADHFPSTEEAQTAASGWAPGQIIDSEEVGLRLSRMMAAELPAGPTGFFPMASPPGSFAPSGPAGAGEAALAMAAGASSMPAAMPMEQLRSLVTQLVRASQRVRKDHRQLTNAERDLFNEALEQAHNTPAYKELVAAHKDMSHRHHGTMPGMPAVAIQRFLPWHRAYDLKFEDLLRTIKPNVTVPYWDYANDHARPDWVWKPSGVKRPTPGTRPDGHPTQALPTQSTIDGLLQRPTFTAFTYGRVMGGSIRIDGLEMTAHNNVHDWCQGTLGSPMTAAEDPIFFLLHANVDRIWDQRQLTHSGGPNVTGADAGLDPWWTQTAGGLTADGVKDITVLGYSYQ
ncbi:tyrosinase family protein [Streptomyces sp. NPDC005507]|uniref:tyrosinase family protein n=1 Tax=unclassified Streptomyces TaxID=2593676 RepID=UPI0033AE47B3